MPTKPSRASALVRAEHGVSPVKLSGSEKLVLNDALREGAAVVDEVEGRLVAFGRYLLAKVFGDDTSAALDARTKNPVWLELVRRAGGPTLRLSRRMVYVAVAIAAWDKRIHDATFRTLDAGRKELLLPLGEERQLRNAAVHVAKLDLTQADTRQYVSSLLTQEGRPRQVRITGKQLGTRAKTLSSMIGSAAVLKRARAMDAKEKTALAKEIEGLRTAASALLRVLR